MSLPLIANIKQKIRAHRNSKNVIIRAALLGLNKLWRMTQTIKGFYADTDFRSGFLLKISNPRNVHQTTSLTFSDRYPQVFAACRGYFGDGKNLKILSFGCSTGEEVLTLRRYFPDAQIVGAEINKRSLTICRQLPADEKITFVYSEPDEIRKHGKFDAVFCMAVLQRTPHLVAADEIRSLKKIYPFEKFERQIIELDGMLNPHGLLVIKFSQYSFLDTPPAAKYKPLENQVRDSHALHLFDRESNLISRPPPQDAIFIKIAEQS